jgi:hypothetical protein
LNYLHALRELESSRHFAESPLADRVALFLVVLRDFVFGRDGEAAVVHVDLDILLLDARELERRGYSVGLGVFVEIHPAQSH